MSEEGLLSCKTRILEMFVSLDADELNSLEQWICSQSYKKDLEAKKLLLKQEKSLIRIGDAIKQIVPFKAEMSSEQIIPPTVGDQADCNQHNTVHVDEFLYDHDEVEVLIKEGRLEKSYCADCNSRNIKELIYISHSMSRQALQYIFKYLLPEDLEGKQVLDVGSRLGTVLYGAYYLSNASNIVGIEMNKDCCDVQEKIIEKFALDRDRIKVIHSDVMDRPDTVKKTDVIVINVLDFFVDVETHKKIWSFFKKNIRKGSYLVCNRSMADTFNSLELEEEFINWVSICRPSQGNNEIFFDIEDCSEIFLYTVN